MPAVIFIAAATTSLLCAKATHVQHGYYHAARERAKQAAAAAGVPDLLRTTPGLRDESRRRRFRILWAAVSLFLALALVGATGAAGVLISA